MTQGTLADLRKAAGLTQMELAQRCGVHVRLVSRWESGEGQPSLMKAVDLARVLGVTLDEIAQRVANDVTPGDIIAEALGEARH